MPDAKTIQAQQEFLGAVERSYAALIRYGVPAIERALGGQLFFVPTLDEESRAWVVAANIAGAATLTVAANAADQKQALRDGVVDFLVNSLDEALRILKNEIRKRETVAVCIAAKPDEVVGEMVERGVLPDLLSSAATGAELTFLTQGARLVWPVEADQTVESQSVVIWSVDTAPAQWLPKLDALALDCLGDEAPAARRWLRLAPRYLGRMAHHLRMLRCQAETAQRIVDRFRGQSEIPVQVELR